MHFDLLSRFLKKFLSHSICNLKKINFLDIFPVVQKTTRQQNNFSASFQKVSQTFLSWFLSFHVHIDGHMPLKSAFPNVIFRKKYSFTRRKDQLLSFFSISLTYSSYNMLPSIIYTNLFLKLIQLSRETSQTDIVRWSDYCI